MISPGKFSHNCEAMENNTYIEKIQIGKSSLWKDNTPLLSKLDIELTERCNFKCIHCYINLPEGDKTAKSRELSTEQVKTILNEAASLGCLTVRFTGGEPLLREDFEELYTYTRKLGLKVILFTNASLISPHLIELFARIPPLKEIEITVYGMCEQTYEEITRTPGSFNLAWRGINLLLENKIPFVVKSVLLPSNMDERKKFVSWASTIPWMDHSPNYVVFLNLRARRDLENKNRIIKKFRLSPEESIKFLLDGNESYTKDTLEFCNHFIGPPGDNLFTCGAGLRSGCVDAYGNFQPCMLLRHPDVVYELKSGTLKDALDPFFSKEVREKKAQNSDYLSRCARCFLKGLCEQCPAISWMEHGTLDTPVEYLCKIGHAQARYLGLLKEDELAWEVEDWEARIAQLTNKNIDQ